MPTINRTARVQAIRTAAALEDILDGLIQAVELIDAPEPKSIIQQQVISLDLIITNLLCDGIKI